MHQPLLLANEERVRLGDGEIIHRLDAPHKLDGLHGAVVAVGVAYLRALPEDIRARGNPLQSDLPRAA
jgi:hypothetical protein